jgi:hypothetical protein
LAAIVRWRIVPRPSYPAFAGNLHGNSWEHVQRTRKWASIRQGVRLSSRPAFASPA